MFFNKLGDRMYDISCKFRDSYLNLTPSKQLLLWPIAATFAICSFVIGMIFSIIYSIVGGVKYGLTKDEIFKTWSEVFKDEFKEIKK